LHVQMPFLCRN